MQHNGPISGVACYKDRFVATAGYDNQLILWDAATGEPIARGLHDHLVNQCEFSPDGALLASASSDYSARIWSVPGMRLQTVLSAHDDDVMKVAFSPDGGRVATCSLDGTLAIYTTDGRPQRRLTGHTGMIEGFDWTRDGSQLHSCGTDGTLRSWSAETGECLGVKDFGGLDLDVLVTLSTGACFVGSGAGDIIHVDPSGESRRITAHASGVKRLIVDPEERLLVSLSYDSTVILWRIGKNGDLDLQRRAVFPDCIWPRSAAFLGDRRMVHATFGSTYAVWDYSSDGWEVDRVGAVRSLNAVAAHGGRVYAIGDAGILLKDGEPAGGARTLCNFLVATGGRIFTGGQKGVLYDATSGAELYAHKAPLNCGLAFERGGIPHLAVGSYSGDILVLRVGPRSLTLVQVLAAHRNAVKGVASDGRQLFSGCADGELAIHDLATGEKLSTHTGAHDGILNDTCVYSQGFATVSRDLTLRLWRGGIPEIHASRHVNSIKCVAADRDRGLIATGSYGGTIEVFDSRLGRWLDPVVRPTTFGISSLCWDGDENRFLASSYDGEIYVIVVAEGASPNSVRAFRLEHRARHSSRREARRVHVEPA